MSSNTWRTMSRFLPLSLPGSGSSIWSVGNIDLVLCDNHKDWNLQHMQTLAGPGAKIHFTNLSKSSSSSLSAEFSSTSEASANSQCHTDGVLDLMKAHGKSPDRICLLDPKADKPLSPEDGNGTFDWFVFGVRTLFLASHWFLDFLCSCVHSTCTGHSRYPS